MMSGDIIAVPREPDTTLVIETIKAVAELPYSASKEALLFELTKALQRCNAPPLIYSPPPTG